ncbi:MAG: T9SS type A sorting domain-containing protein [Chlorobi bacterium]|nr:T9SS type A sorting domain-containing protein [Chlorobiota bacterium]
MVIKDTELLNLEGREVKRFKKGLTVLKVSDIPAGPYVLRINTSEGVFTEKVVVE